MSNTLLTPSIIAKEALMLLENNLVMGSKVTRDYNKEFQKVGSTITIRKPVKFQAVKATTLSIQNIVETSTTLQLTTQAHVGFQLYSQDLTLVIDEFAERYLKPSMIAIANAIDYDLTGLATQCHNIVGTPGTTPANFAAIAAATQKLQEEACPTNDGIIGVVNPKTAWTLANGLSQVYNQKIVEENLTKGWMGSYALADWYTDQNVQAFTVGTYASTTMAVSGASQTGASILTKNWTSGDFLNAGDVIQILNVNAVNPVSQQNTGSVRNFVVTATCTANSSGKMTIPIYPPITTSGPYQTVTASPADGATIAIATGASAAVHPQNIVFHPQAFCLATAPLAVPDGAVWAASESYNGLSMRIVKAYDITNDLMLCRLDVLYGVKALYPEMACRLTG